MGKARKSKTHGSTARAAADSGTAVSAQETQPLLSNQLNKSNTGMDMNHAGVLEGLTSLKALTRESSCAAIASLFEKIDSPDAAGEAWSAAQRLIAGGLVKKLLPRLVDRVPDVKLQAAGAMRNISAVHDPRVCEIMVQDDCLTPVLALLDRMSNADSAAAAAAAAATTTATVAAPRKRGSRGGGGVGAPAAMTITAGELDQVVMVQLVATLCNILAAVDAAVGRFTKQGGLQVVMRLLQAAGCRGNAEVFAGALQALHVATDSNRDLARQLTTIPGAVGQLSSLVTGAPVTPVVVSISMRLQAAGILVNIAGSSEEARTVERQAELGGLILPLVLEQMVYDPKSLDRACAALASNKEEQAASSGDDESMEVDGGGDGRNNAAAGVRESAAGPAAAVAAVTPMHIVTSEVFGGGEGSDSSVSGQRSGRVCETKSSSGEVDKESGVGKEQEEIVSPAAQPDKDAEIRWEWKLGVAEPLKLAAEVMTNLCALAAAEEGSGDEDDDEEWGSDDEDAMEQAANSGGGLRQDQATGESSVLLQALADRGAMQRTVNALRALLSPTPRDRVPAKGEVPGVGAVGAEAATGDGGATRLALPSGTAGDIADLRVTVALCAANLVQNLPAKALGTDPHILWSELCGMCEAAMERAPSCVETLTGVMWGLVRRAGPAVSAGIRQSTTAGEGGFSASGSGSELGLPVILLTLCDPGKTRSFEARVNAVGILGALGAAAVPPTSDSAAGVRSSDVGLGRALVQAMEDPHVLVHAEALNAVMDVFGDDDRDAAFRACGAAAALVGGVPAFKRKVKQEGKSVGRDAMCHLRETALNATRFVKYKQASAVAADGRGPS
ncbi:unnamed protein product [Sphacelaria rigidula]